MAVILEAVVAYFRSSSMVNFITAVQWMDTGKNGAPRPMISPKNESGDCVSISGIFTPEYFPERFPLFLPNFLCYKGNGS